MDLDGRKIDFRLVSRGQPLLPGPWLTKVCSENQEAGWRLVIMQDPSSARIKTMGSAARQKITEKTPRSIKGKTKDKPGAAQEKNNQKTTLKIVKSAAQNS